MGLKPIIAGNGFYNAPPSADGGPPTGSASGDLSGSYPSPTVAKIGGVAVTIDTDGTLSENSDAKLASQKATRTYADAKAAAAQAAAIAASEPVLTAVTQAEAEAGTGTNKRSWTPERVAQAIAALAPGGGGSPISDPLVGYIRSDGNDTTGDGSINAPFATFQKAVDEGFRVLDFGTNPFDSDFGSCLYVGGNLTLHIRGCGDDVTTLRTLTVPNGNLSLHDIGSYSFRIYASSGIAAIRAYDAAAPGSSGHQVSLNGVLVDGDVQAIGIAGAGDSPGNTGGRGGTVVLSRGARVQGGNIYVFGGEGSAGDGSNPGGNGGVGGSVLVEDSWCNYIYASGGGGGADNGAGAGVGANGGTITMRNSRADGYLYVEVGAGASGGSAGTIDLKASEVTGALNPDAATVTAAVIAGYFYANSYP